MVRLTRSVVLQGISKVYDKRDTLEIVKEFGRITHLHLQRKNITMLDSLHLFQSLTVLYLYENQISKIEGFEQALNLEILHLQRNRLKRIENLLNCKKLRKLYLGYNEIETVEGLHNLEKLEVLHLECQRLNTGMSLTFDPKSLSTLSNCLLILNISGNNITHIEDLAGMEELHTLLASQNSIQDLDSTSLVIRTLTNLRVLDLRDNDYIARKPQFKQRIIGFGRNLEILNGKEVSEATRDFIQRFVSVKASRLHSLVMNKASDSSVIPEVSNLPPQRSGSSFYDYEYIPSNSLYASSASLGDSQFELTPNGMSPTKSNLVLNLPGHSANIPGQVYPSRSTPQPTRRSLSQMHSYLSKTEIPERIQNSMPHPQFILAPPSFHHQNYAGGASGDLRSSLKKGNSLSIPSFKQNTSKDDEDQDLFKSPKINQDEMWVSKGHKNRHGSSVIKTPCSRQTFVEGMPMPNTSMLRMDPTNSSQLNDVNVIFNRSNGNGSTRNKSFVKSNINKSDNSCSSHNKLLFTTSVFEFPPWPHIKSQPISSASQPVVTFMP